MGVVRTAERRKAELEELHREIVRTISLTTKGGKWKKEGHDNFVIEEPAEENNKLVCVTSGISLLGFAIVNRLLSRGYLVRIVLESQGSPFHFSVLSKYQLLITNRSHLLKVWIGFIYSMIAVEDLERLGEMGAGENCKRISVMMAQLTNLESLCEVFSGCSGVFHTSSYVDPAGLSGYSKHMADLECTAAEKMIEACARTESVRRCVFTSSLLACVWQANDNHLDRPRLLDESCWSDETLCRDKKLWLALGKTKAERAVWRIAQEGDVKLTTICPALVTCPQLSHRNSTATIAYLKGAKEMYRKRSLATVSVDLVAEAHVRVYETQGACGRFICYERVIDREEDAAQLVPQIATAESVGTQTSVESEPPLELSNSKLYRLMCPLSSCKKP
ncbi:cinnamoyl-CoA reductase-like SNL6 isoform X1 [Aristolochia californica]|uniref:cinnamoyl-CoA reductase-like SNL6 isoform X1 n=1 Tax=Aristolochia californica TaxID=171875 RepID=UPI0035DCC3E5